MAKEIVEIENVKMADVFKQGGRVLTNLEVREQLKGDGYKRFKSYRFWTATHIEHGENATKATVWNDGETEKTEIDYPTGGWRETEPKYGIPNGKELSSSNKEANYLYRFNSYAYNGLVVRWGGRFIGNRRYVDCGYGDYLFRCGVLVEREKKAIVKDLSHPAKVEFNVMPHKDDLITEEGEARERSEGGMRRWM